MPASSEVISKAVEVLNAEGLVVVTLAGVTLGDLRQQGKEIPNPWEGLLGEYTDIEALSSARTLAAVPSYLHLPYSNRLTLVQQRAANQDYFNKLQRKTGLPSLRLIDGAVDYIEAAFRYYELTGRHFPGEDRGDYVRTGTSPFPGGKVVIGGMTQDGQRLNMHAWPSDFRGNARGLGLANDVRNIWATPLVAIG